MTDAAANPEINAVAPKRKIWIVIIFAAFGFFLYFCGFYSIQPIGALPEGSTILVWRNSGEPIFNSPDAVCLKRTGNVSLMCRGLAMGQAPVDRIVMRLPYIEAAYSLSTDGHEFDR
jgi:hypothetical protein